MPKHIPPLSLDTVRQFLNIASLVECLVADLTVRPTLDVEDCSEMASVEGVNLLKRRFVGTPAVAVIE